MPTTTNEALNRLKRYAEDSGKTEWERLVILGLATLVVLGQEIVRELEEANRASDPG